MNVEINDPHDCTFITQQATQRLEPGPGESRRCEQCDHETWSHTPRCMWCGFDTSAKFVRWVAVGGLALVLLLSLTHLTP